MSTSKSTSRSWWARNVWVLLLAALLVAGSISVFVSSSGDAARLESQEARIKQLEGQVNTRTQARDTKVDVSLAQALGITPSRVKSDGAQIQTFMRTLFTWDSGESYEEARESLKRRYKLDEKDPFLRGFMPPARFNVDEAGKRYYYIDSIGLRSTLPTDVRIEVVRVSGDSYEYAVIADVDAIRELSEQELTVRDKRVVLLYVTVDGEGGFSNLRGVPPSGHLRTSG